MSTPQKPDRDTLFLKMFFKASTDVVTDEELEYFRDHADEIDDFCAPIKIHKFFLAVGAILGISLVGVSKLLKHIALQTVMSEGVKEFVIDIIFEVGVALIGAAVTAFLLGILLNHQQKNASKWRAEVRRRITEQERSD